MSGRDRRSRQRHRGETGGAAVGGGIGAVAASLKGVGVPDDVVPEYESALKADQYLVIVYGPPADVDAARQTLDRTAATRIDTHIHERTAT